MENLTKSQKFVLMNVKQGKNIFIQGVAGTGKTYLLKKLEELTGKTVRLYGTSGLASINLGGYTISSNNGLSLGLYDLDEKQIKKLNSYKWNYKHEIIVIDEVALLSEEQLKQIDFALRCRGERNKDFGGFQLVIAGDFKQMPHIGWGKNLKNSSMLNNFKVIELVENVRQAEDVPFFNILKDVRENGFSKEVINFIYQNHKKQKESGIQIVATRQLMDELNNSLKAPKGLDIHEYKCDLNHQDRAYDSIKLWEGMPVIITRNNNRKGYYNGDTGVIVDFDKNDKEVKVKLDRTGETVWVSFVEEEFKTKESINFEKFKIKTELVDLGYWDDSAYDYEAEEGCEWVEHFVETEVIYLDNIVCYPSQLENINEIKAGKTKTAYKVVYNEYEYMPLLPASYLSIRRCQGLTLSNGTLHESILNAELYNSKDSINIQYVALSRFEKISQVHIEGLDEEKTEKTDNCCSVYQKEGFTFCPICGNKIKEKIKLKIA